MRWKQGRRSDNVEDRRGARLGGGLKLGGIGILLILALSIFTGQNPLELLALLTQQQGTSVSVPDSTSAPAGGYDEQKDFVAVVLADTEDTWGQLFTDMNRRYDPPKLVLFTDAVQSACGFASAAVGPFYCPADNQLYIDLRFFQDLDSRFGAPGDFAQAYVVAHEVGHHIQNQLGISDKVHSMQQRSSEENANALSVRLELQADCLAGVWGHYANRERQLLEPGDLEEGLRAAAAVGDDRIQQQSGGTISPETWTHGSSEMRMKWFRRGYQDGDVSTCDTFNE